MLPCLLVLAASSPPVHCGPAADSDTSAARRVLAACVIQVDTGITGLEALAARCPGLEGALNDLGLPDQLPNGWQQHVTTRTLSAWSDLAARYAGVPSQAVPDTGVLRDIAASLQLPVSPPSRLEKHWVQLRAWLRELGRWWRRYLPGSDATPMDSLFNGLTALVIAGAAAVVVIELRAAGVLSAWKRRSRPARPGTTGTVAVVETSGSLDLASAPPYLRAVLLLRALVAVLTRSRRLEREGALTCRELVTHAHLDTDAQRQHFAALALLAERGLYGGKDQTLSAQEDTVLVESQRLEGQLATPAAQSST
jgi:hypothetical protein